MNIIPITAARENIAELVHPHVNGFTTFEWNDEVLIGVTVTLEPPDESDAFETTTVTHSITKADAVRMIHELADLVATH